MAKQQSQGLSPVEKQLWGLGISFGVVSILFGVLALFLPTLTVGLLVAFFGIFVLVWGIVGLIVSLSSVSTDKFWWLELLFSVLAIGLAVYVLRNPVETAAIFVFFIGITFLVRGVIDVIKGIFGGGRSGNGRAYSIILGVLGVIAGIITLSYPVSAGLVVVWVIGLYAVLYGSLLIAFAFKERAELGE